MWLAHEQAISPPFSSHSNAVAPFLCRNALRKWQPWTACKKLSQWKKFSIKDPETSSVYLSDTCIHIHTIHKHSHAHTHTLPYICMCFCIGRYKQNVCFIRFARKTSTLRIRNVRMAGHREERRSYIKNIYIRFTFRYMYIYMSVISEQCVCVLLKVDKSFGYFPCAFFRIWVNEFMP